MPLCRWCREPLEIQQVTYEGISILADCIRPACVAARQQELGRRQDARALSNWRPQGRVWRCLPGLCEPYRSTPPGEAPMCRHCEALLPREGPSHA